MFWFLLLAMVVVVAAVTLAVVGGGRSAILQDVAPEQLTDPLPATRPVGRADVEALRLPVTARGYRMTDVDEALGRLGAELAERDARIAELESALAGAQATRAGRPDLLKGPQDRPQAPWQGPWQEPWQAQEPSAESAQSAQSTPRPDEEDGR
ncbi:hypothetical protein [Streptomyces laculatispora]|uniref:hypothetical protein n=1 Tax=Streptomyces laculatispora TaxID=887464 RepID=UPI001A93E210|nr:hypothetical protein [Streptomyces laculatispora]MBO0915547.1 hypothetical protein [Streptomyces laculatispora]